MVRDHTDSAAAGRGGGAPPAAQLWFPVALLIAVHVLFAAFEVSPLPLRNGVLGGTDSYMRLVRVEALVESGDWYDAASHRSNTPYGEVLHWTRPLDALLVAGAAPLAPLVGFRTALFWWGALISPVLHVAALIALMWAARPVIERRHLVYLGVLAVAQPAVLGYFAAGRPDHHSLFGLIFVCLLGFVLRLLARPFAIGTAIAAGVAGAALLWVSVEGLLAVALAFAALGLAWIGTGGDFAKKSLGFAAALFGGVALALVVERPWHGLGVDAYDRLSIVHLAVAGAALAFWLIARGLERGGRLTDGAARRAAIAAAGAAAAAGAVWLIYPKFFASPLVDIDPRVISLWSGNITELRPIVDPERPLRSARKLIFLLGPAAVAAPYVAYRLWRRRDAAWPWVGIGLALVAYGVLATRQVRFAPYAELVALIPYAALLAATLERFDARLAVAGASDRARDPPWRRAGRAAGRGGIVAGFAVWFIVAGALIFKLEAGNAPAAADCPLPAMAGHLADPARLGDRPRRIMAFVFHGPEILYRTPHAVVGTPYHRNADGILDTYRFFTATEPETPRRIAERRGIDLVLICLDDYEAARYRDEFTAATFYRRLEEGPAPAWLEPLPLPDDLADSFRLFRVAEPGAAP